MTSRHHPAPRLLARYAASALESAPALVLEAHLEVCPSCRGRVLALDETHATDLEAMPPAVLSADALSQALLRIDAAGREPSPAPTKSRIGDVELPRALAETQFHARRWMTPGLWAAHLKKPRQDGWRTFLLCAPAHTTIPLHAHDGDELISVLTGAYHDGQTYRAGDFATNLTGSAHAMHVEGDEPCVCLIAIKGAMQWRGWSRAIGPILGI
ncbi:MAG: cupin domain-containing protein [bacterium]|nr:cupin domain-containing protein [bacterium]